MNYFPFHVGDYSSHTSHLDLIEDLAYRRMLDAYYLRECPLPGDIQEVARLIRMRSHVAEVEAVLREFFTKDAEGWRHARCDEEIDRMQDKQKKQRDRANKRWHKSESLDSDATAMPRQCHGNANAMPPTPTPTPTPEDIKDNAVALPSKKRAVHVDGPPDVDETVWLDFVALRKQKKAAVTLTAINNIRSEAAKAGIGLTEALAMCCARGWVGFKAEWVKNTQETFRERDERMARDRMAQFAPGAVAKPFETLQNVIDVTPIFGRLE